MAGQNRKALVTDLETQRCAIVEQTAPADLDEAPALMWRFMMRSTRFERGRLVRSWPPKRDGERNEALDTFV